MHTSILLSQQATPLYEIDDKNHVMDKKYWEVWNKTVQKTIDSNIEKYRKADALIKIDNIKKGTKVKVEQISHKFIFGAHIFNFNQLGSTEMNDKYKSLYGTLFNSATVAFYWKKFEPNPGDMRFEEKYEDTQHFWNNLENAQSHTNWRRPSTDPVIAFCKEKGIRIHGHPMIWGNRHWHSPEWLFDSLPKGNEKIFIDSLMYQKANDKNNVIFDGFTDKYRNLSDEELINKLPKFSEDINTLFKMRVYALAAKYKNDINSWDVVNESAVDYGKGVLSPNKKLCKSSYGIMPGDYPYNAFKEAQSILPENVMLNINDYKNDKDYINEIKSLLDRGCRIDIVGSQMHLFDPRQCLSISLGDSIETPTIVWNKMKLLTQAGKPIHLSEITITAPENSEKGLLIQSIITQNLYRLWFSIPSMMGITWWNVVDNCGAPGEPSTSGLFTRDMKEKPVYYTLNNLINNEWKTNITCKADKNGNISFRGFKGEYILSWKDKNGKNNSKRIVVE